MFMRFIQLNLDSGSIDSFQEYYEQKVIPQLEQMPGCLFVGLVRNHSESEKFISVTLWENKDFADAYESSGLYQKFLRDQTSFLENPFEWKVQLSKDLKLEYLPQQTEPDLKELAVQEHAGESLAEGDDENSLYLRIVAAKIAKNKMDELRNLYKNEILPELISKHGCRYAYLTQNLKDKDEFFSITIWDNRALVEQYESSGAFELLVEKVKHTFVNIFRWQSSLQKSSGTKIASSADVNVSRYKLLSGKRVGKSDA